MKHLSFILLFVMTASAWSCQKKEIPTPEEEPQQEPAPALYVKGTFNGEPLHLPIDGEHYSAEARLTQGQADPPFYAPALWDFVLRKGGDTGQPLLVVTLSNHDWVVQDEVADLQKTLDTPTLAFVYDLDPDPFQLGRVIVEYLPSATESYLSFPVANEPLNVLESKDTLVDGVPYRIATLAGDVQLQDPFTQEAFVIEDFEARIAFGNP